LETRSVWKRSSATASRPSASPHSPVSPSATSSRSWPFPSAPWPRSTPTPGRWRSMRRPYQPTNIVG